MSVMPCTAKKFEIGRPDESAAGVPDVDYSITTRELARMITQVPASSLMTLPDEEFDDPLGECTGAGVIFGATGGVMEAALRTAVETLTGEELPKRGIYRSPRHQRHQGSHLSAWRDMDVKRCGSLRPRQRQKACMETVKHGEAHYHFIEIMGCPGGCVNGGGPRTQPSEVYNFNDLRALRARALYTQRCSQGDPQIPRKPRDRERVRRVFRETGQPQGA